MDEIARAYATLGVPPGSPFDAVRKRYKALVRQWHPDRFASDPSGQAEAMVRMRAINDAFRLVAERVVHTSTGGYASPPAASAPFTARPREPEFGRRLTREEIDRMVEAMKNDGPFDWVLDSSWTDGWRDRPYYSTKGWRRKALAGLLAAATVFPLLALAAGLGLSERASIRLVLGGGVTCFLFLQRALPK